METPLRSEEHVRVVADDFARIGRTLASHRRVQDVFSALCSTAIEAIPTADAASVTRGKDGRFVTEGPTGPLATLSDQIQYELNDGPCVHAVRQDRVFRTGDVEHDQSWPEFGRRVAELGVRSVLSFRLFLEDDDAVIAALNLYSTRSDAYDGQDEEIGGLLATHGSIAMAAALAHERAEHLERALQTNRDIGTAIGILMSERRFTRQQAFDALRVVSQVSNRRIAAIAQDVIDTGTLAYPEDDGASRSAGPGRVAAAGS